MTDGERMAVAITLSLVIHYVAFATAPPTHVSEMGDGGMAVDLTTGAQAMVLAPSVTLETAVSEPEEKGASADRRRRALNAYLERLSRAIHARRMARGDGTRFVGNALFAFTIDAAGRINGVRLVQTSGNGDLDADAARAIAATSGAVPRPKLLGIAPLSVSLRVKYQFGL